MDYARPRASNAKRERETDELVEEFHGEGRYQGREEEVAGRIVNTQRVQQSETKAEKAKNKAGTSPDEDLPSERYDHLTVDQVVGKPDDLRDGEIRQIEKYEQRHRNRKTLRQNFERHLQ